MAEHGDVLGDDRKRMYCDGVWKQLRARGREDDWETMAEAADETRKAFGMRTKRAQMPSESYKSKLASVSRGAGPSGGGSRTVTMGTAEKKMANAMFAHMPNEAERYKHWAATAGRKLLSKKTG